MALPVITPQSIAELKLLGNGHKPVFRVTLSNHAQIPMIIKGEVNVQDADQHISMVWTSKLMRNSSLQANRQIVVAILTPAEIAEFKKEVKRRYGPASDAVFHSNGTSVWVKMPEVTGISDLDLLANNTASLGKIRRAVSTFMRDGIWKQLGQVVAVDLFNGNNDRFDYFGNWANKGNIMFANDQLIGLDTWSPPDFMTSSATDDVSYDGTHGPSNLVRQGGFDALNILIDSQRQLVYAQKVTQSVGDELFTYATKAGAGQDQYITLKLYTNEVARIRVDNLPKIFQIQADEFAQGLQLGANQMKTYLQAKIKQYKSHNGNLNAHKFMGQRGQQAGSAPTGTAKSIPQGILDRMEYLGWMPKVGW